MKRTECIYLLLLLVFLVGIVFGSPAWQNLHAMERPVIVSLSGIQSTYSNQIIESFEKQVSSQFPRAEFVRFSLSKSSEDNSQVLQDVNKRKPSLLLTLGSKATDMGLRLIPDVPIVAAMILDGNQLKGSPRATGVLLNFPPEVHLQWLRRFLPNANRVAIIYNPEENNEWIAALSKTAHKFDFDLNPLPVESAKELPAELKSIGRTADVLLGIPDKIVYSGKTAKAVLLSTFRNRIPFAGLSPSWVKAGALYSLDWDYVDMGKQCSLLAVKILTGTAVEHIDPVAPEKVQYVINMKTAEHMRVTIDPALIQGAKKVYR